MALTLPAGVQVNAPIHPRFDEILTKDALELSLDLPGFAPEAIDAVRGLALPTHPARPPTGPAPIASSAPATCTPAP